MTLNRQHAALVAILAGALGLRVWLAAATPPLFAPDEASHLRYVHLVAMAFDFPKVCGNLVWAQEHGGDAFFHPPLFYLLAAPAYRAGLAWPYGPVYAVRAFNILLSLCVVLVCYGMARQIFQRRPAIALLAAAFVGWLPSFASNSASVNNDVLSILFISIAIYLVVASVMRGRLTSTAVALAVVVGAAAQYTKASALVLLPCYWLWALVLRRQRVRRWWIPVLISVACVATVLPWWLLHNVPAYGDPLGLSIDWPADHRPLWVRAILLLIYLSSSYWAVFGRVNEVRESALFLGAPIPVLAVALRRLYEVWRERGALDDRQRASLLVLALLLLATAAGFVKFAIDHNQGQGRYLFPAISTAGIGIAFGLCDLWRRREGLVALVVMAAIASYAVGAITTLALPAFSRVTVVELTPGPLPLAPEQAGDYLSWVRDRVVPDSMPNCGN